MRLPECPDATLPAADRLSRAPLRSGKQLVAPPATHTDKPAGPATYDALVSVLALLVLMLLTGCAAVPERLEVASRRFPVHAVLAPLAPHDNSLATKALQR